VNVYHGPKLGKGVSVEMTVKERPGYFIVGGLKKRQIDVAGGRRRIGAGPIFRSENTNSRYRFSIGGKALVNEWNRHGPATIAQSGVGILARD